jgi:hypothetical protein
MARELAFHWSECRSNLPKITSSDLASAKVKLEAESQKLAAEEI